MTKTLTRYGPTSWTLPSDADERAWTTLTRDEQVDSLREVLASHECTTTVDTTVDEIVRRTRADRAARSGGKL